MPSNNRPHSIFTFLKPRPKKVVLFPEIGRAKFVLITYPPALSKLYQNVYFLLQKKKKGKNTDTQTNKKEKKLKKISWL